MRVLAVVLLTLSSAFAYQVTFPGVNNDWNTTGPNYLEWERVSTDPLNFTAVLTNVDSNTNQILANTVDGTTGIALCPPPAGGWPSGSGFRVNLAQDATHLDSLLAQSSEFSINATSSSSTASSGTQTGSSSTTGTAAATSPATSSGTTTSSQTGTTPTGTSAASLSADSRVGVFSAAVAITLFALLY